MELRIKGVAPEAEWEALGPESTDPFLLVIFGASGDLTARKLIPALYKLFLHGSLPDAFSIVGCSRTPYSDDQFRGKMEKACLEGARCDRWAGFAAHLHYKSLTYDDPANYTSLSEYLRKLDEERQTGWNRIFYLAVPPSLLPKISEMIGSAGLSGETGGQAGWARIVAEKPFGRDLASALELDRILHRSFSERQIFRIDHYMAKETVQNILMLRFANAIFEPVWNRTHIDFVGMITAEQLGVEHRAGYYEQAGVLRDMFQNHMLQLLAMTAMEPPSHFEADQVRDEKVKVFRALKSLTEEGTEGNLVLGQYAAGTVDGRPVPAYRDEPGVDHASLVPTFAMLRVFVDNWRWGGVPFYLASGKRLARKDTRIVIQFRKVPHSLFEKIMGRKIIANRLVLGIYPEEGIKLTFETKVPGPRVRLRSVTMDFKYFEEGGPVLDAYERVLLDIIQGDQMLFWRQDAVDLCWSFLTPILESCETCDDRAARLNFYEAGSWGPEPAREWIRMIVGE
ncbi:MAG: glucose-6-phosphate dehydrogenase [Desulfobacteraceae bacterium]|nr:glucose-6-phosphate dehydrogenase [Desulfobacteraceae bacterium]